jgi:hypothetical protein
MLEEKSFAAAGDGIQVVQSVVRHCYRSDKRIYLKQNLKIFDHVPLLYHLPPNKSVRLSDCWICEQKARDPGTRHWRNVQIVARGSALWSRDDYVLSQEAGSLVWRPCSVPRLSSWTSKPCSRRSGTQSQPHTPLSWQLQHGGRTNLWGGSNSNAT